MQFNLADLNVWFSTVQSDCCEVVYALQVMFSTCMSHYPPVGCLGTPAVGDPGPAVSVFQSVEEKRFVRELLKALASLAPDSTDTMVELLTVLAHRELGLQ